jgi:DNA-binding LytR/AlgR family response regulator
MITCLIIDDDPVSRKHLMHLCEKAGEIEVKGVFESAIDALGTLSRKKVDFLLLDIEMPELTGIELIRMLDQIPQVIITSSKEEYAVEAFELADKVLDYLVKPVTLSRFMQAIQRVKKQELETPTAESDSFIFIKSEGKLIRIDIDDLLFVETVGDYLVFQTTSKKHMVHSTLKQMNEKLTHPNMLKVHRSYIVNVSKIIDIEENSVLIGKKVIPVSRANKASLMDRINPL